MFEIFRDEKKMPKTFLDGENRHTHKTVLDVQSVNERGEVLGESAKGLDALPVFAK